jgi:hypothetical protein
MLSVAEPLPDPDDDWLEPPIGEVAEVADE